MDSRHSWQYQYEDLDIWFLVNNGAKLQFNTIRA